MKCEGSETPSVRNIERKWMMRRECARLMAGAAVACFFSCLLSIAAPTLVSVWLGDMADALLALDGPAIYAQLPPFLGAIFVTVLLAPGMTFLQNLLLTRQGTAYDLRLMERALNLPLKQLHQMDAGEFLHRFQVERTLYYLSVVHLLSYPLALGVYAVGGIYLMTASRQNHVFYVCMILLSGMSVLYETMTARRRAMLSQETAGYQSRRNQLELEILALRDVSVGYGWNQFLIERLHHLFGAFWKETGREHSGKKAVGQVFQFLCGYGIQVVGVLLGVAWMCRGSLTVGELLGGYLLLPTWKQGWEYVKQVVEAREHEDKYGERMEYFYQDPEPKIGEGGGCVPRKLVVQDVDFAYAQGEPPVLSQVHMTLDGQAHVHLVGGNGCGKTTLANIVGGIYPPDRGCVKNEDGEPLSVQRLRNAVAVQEQMGMVFTGSVWENLFLPEEKRRDAQQLLSELGFTKTLEYRIENDGKNLSPGEKKKLLLTRAFLKKAAFLVLDEPLNHLDDSAQKVLRAKLEQRKGGLILISHRDIGSQHLSLEQVVFSGDC